MTFAFSHWVNYKRPSRSQAILIYVRNYSKRFRHRKKTSYPYLSSDAFAAVCDFKLQTALDVENFNYPENIQPISVYVRSSLFEKFLKLHSEKIKGRVVFVTGNEDNDWFELPPALNDLDFHWFAQNSFITDSRITVLPIGIENLSLATNGKTRHLTKIPRERQIRDRILTGPFNDTHADRHAVMTYAIKRPTLFDIPNRRMRPADYQAMAAEYRFVLCPRGNGVDTHRLWEALYRDSIPLIADNSWARAVQKSFPQVCLYKDFDEISPAWLAAHDAQFSSSDVAPLWMPYWEAKIREALYLE